MTLSTWTPERLTAQFDEYRARYWPDHPGLARFSIRFADLRSREWLDQGDRALGQCEFESHDLLIDPAAHDDDATLCATLLHEMAHAAAGSPGHHAAFWEQLEHLLQEKAPIVVGLAELAESGRWIDVIPVRFVLARAAFQPADEAYQHDIDDTADAPSHELTPGEIEQEAYDAAIEVAGDPSWADLWVQLCFTYPFRDRDGRTLPGMEPYEAAGRRGWERGWAERHEEDEARGAWHQSRQGSIGGQRERSDDS